MTHPRSQIRAAIVAHLVDATAEARAANAQPVLDRTVMAPTAELQPGTTPLAIGYAWLKRQPDYARAVDC